MTALAVRAEFAIMNIVIAVTVRALLPEPCLAGQRLPVASFTTDIGMRSVERKLRLRSVIELPLFPVNGVVAARACFAESTVVGIVVTMTVDALFRRVPEYVGFVTIAAFCFRVFAEEGEASQVVVKEYFLFPRGFVVAVGTLISL